MIKEVDSTFDEHAFLTDALIGYQELELTPRAWQIAHALGRHLPQDYERAIEILLASLGPKLEAAELTGMDVFIYLPHVFYVAKFGVDHFEASMRAQYELTQRFTAEYSIRGFQSDTRSGRSTDYGTGQVTRTSMYGGWFRRGPGHGCPGRHGCVPFKTIRNLCSSCSSSSRTILSFTFAGRSPTI